MLHQFITKKVWIQSSCGNGISNYMYYDLFNGDADGMISTHMYRTFMPKDSIKFTGMKRDIKLLRHVTKAHDSIITVFDVSLASNDDYVEKILQNNNNIRWFDHHDPGETDFGDRLMAKIDPDPDCCTAILVDKHLDGLYRPWTIAAAFGDNLHKQAEEMNPNMSQERMDTLRTIGETLNYSGYGNTEDDLLAQPIDIYEDMAQYRNPFNYFRRSRLFHAIHDQMLADKEQLSRSTVLFDEEFGMVVQLPSSVASSRYSGIYSNDLAMSDPDKAFAIVTANGEDFKVSIRAPINRPTGAVTLANQFPTGGGREKAAGINVLPQDKIHEFYSGFSDIFNV